MKTDTIISITIASAALIIAILAWTSSRELSSQTTGPRGLMGEPGPVGPMGSRGEKGDRGDPGPTTEWDNIPNKPEFHPVSFTGDYNDLSNRIFRFEQIPSRPWIYEVYTKSDTIQFDEDQMESVVTGPLTNRFDNSIIFDAGPISQLPKGFAASGELWVTFQDSARQNPNQWAKISFNGINTDSGISHMSTKVIDSSDGQEFENLYRILIYIQRLDLLNSSQVKIGGNLVLFRRSQDPPGIQPISISSSGYIQLTTIL